MCVRARVWLCLVMFSVIDNHILFSLKGFAISLPLLVSRTNARLDPDAKIGYLESSILEKLVAIDELEPKASNCTKVSGMYHRY